MRRQKANSLYIFGISTFFPCHLSPFFIRFFFKCPLTACSLNNEPICSLDWIPSSYRTRLYGVRFLIVFSSHQQFPFHVYIFTINRAFYAAPFYLLFGFSLLCNPIPLYRSVFISQ